MLIDQFLEDAIEIDVDALCDGEDVVIGGIMEHIEEAGIHSGDSLLRAARRTFPSDVLDTIRDYTAGWRARSKVVGLMNVQYAIKDEQGLRARGEPARLAHRAVRLQGHRRAAGQDRRAPDGRAPAARVPAGKSNRRPRPARRPEHRRAATTSSRRSSRGRKFPGVDTVLGPEMKSTGEVMGMADNFGEAFAKAQLAAGQLLPRAARFHQRQRPRQAEAVPSWRAASSTSDSRSSPPTAPPTCWTGRA